MKIKKILASVLAAFISFGTANIVSTSAADDKKSNDTKIQEILQEKILEQKETIKKLEKELENQKSKPPREIIIHERKVPSKKKISKDDLEEEQLWLDYCLATFGTVSLYLIALCLLFAH